MDGRHNAPAGPIEPRRLSDEIRARFESMIVSREYAPDDSLPSGRYLMERFGVGLSVIREALFPLQKMGLVTLTSGARPRVTAPSADRKILEPSVVAKYFSRPRRGERAFQDARVFFEVGLARRAALYTSDEEIANLERALALMPRR